MESGGTAVTADTTDMFHTPQDTQGRRPRGRLSGWMNSLMGNTFTPRRDGDDAAAAAPPPPAPTDAGAATPAPAPPTPSAVPALEAVSPIVVDNVARCNNDERAWLRAAADRVEIMAREVGDFQAADDNDGRRLADLLKNARRTRQELVAAWKEMEEDCRKRHRMQAREQAARIWAQIDDHIHKIVSFLHQLQVASTQAASTGAVPRVVIQPPQENAAPPIPPAATVYDSLAHGPQPPPHQDQSQRAVAHVNPVLAAPPEGAGMVIPGVRFLSPTAPGVPPGAGDGSPLRRGVLGGELVDAPEAGDDEFLVHIPLADAPTPTETRRQQHQPAAPPLLPAAPEGATAQQPPSAEDRRRRRERDLALGGLGPVLQFLTSDRRDAPARPQRRLHRPTDPPTTARPEGGDTTMERRIYDNLQNRLTEAVRESQLRMEAEFGRQMEQGWEQARRQSQQQFEELTRLLRAQQGNREQDRPRPADSTPTRRDRDPRVSTPQQGNDARWAGGAQSHSEILAPPPTRAHSRDPQDHPRRTFPSTIGGARPTGPLPELIRRYAADIPNYGAVPTRPAFNLAGADEPAEWYQNNFPYPWDEPPNAEAEFITQIKRLRSVCPKFSGELPDYAPWAHSFLANVHRANATVGFKATCLKECIDGTKDTKLRELVKGMGTSRDDYAQAIEHLDRWYGHPEGLLAARLQELHRVPTVHFEHLEEAEIWFLRLQHYCRTAKSMGRTADLVATALYEENLGRMDKTLRRSYLEWQKRYAPCRDILSIMAWLDEYLAGLREASRPGEKKSAQVGFFANEDRNGATAAPSRREPRAAAPPVGSTPRILCPLCDASHGLAMCDRFKKSDPEEKRKWLNDWQRCYSCLQPGHRINECSAGIKCGKCTKNHHTLVHEVRFQRRRRRERIHFSHEEEDDGAWSDASSVVADACFTSQAAKKGVSLQTAPVSLFNPDTRRRVELNLLMDPGATGAFLSKQAAEELGATGHTLRTEITGFGGIKKEIMVTVVKLQVAAASARNGKRHWVEFQVTDNPAASYQPHDWAQRKESFPHLAHLPIPPPIPNRKVDILLGMSAPHLLTSLQPDVGGRNAGEPVARLTRLGWVVGGPTGERSSEQEAQLAFFTGHLMTPPPGDSGPWSTWRMQKKADHTEKALLQTEPDARDMSKLTKIAEAELGAAVTRMWEIDTSLKPRPDSPLDDAILGKLKKEMKIVQGKYQLPTLWKAGHPKLPNNYSFAKRRLKSLEEGKYFKDAQIRKEYLANMDAWLEEDQVEEVHSDAPDQDRANYLAHFAVVNQNKISSSVRPVMDGKARGAAGVALNDCLHKGPKLINELNLVFLRFRHKSITIGADVRKMFYQIRMAPEDRDWHRFLWPSPQGTKIYRWKVHPFGSAASPCVAMFTIKEHARRYRELYPRAADTVLKSTLVDDNLDSADTVEEAQELARQLKGLYSEAGMELRKVVSNSNEVWEQFSEVERSPSLNIAEICTKDLTLPLVKTLGVIYISEEDAFTFHMKTPDQQNWTKRTVLSFEAQLYDPHGLVAPYIVQARALIQDMWRAQLDWDDPLPSDILRKWTKWLSHLPLLSQLRIPRCLHNIPNGAPNEEELHVFCDASDTAYAAVAYWVTTRGSVRSSRLAVARAKVAPLHQLSIPRLELLATQLALDVVELMVQALPLSMTSVWLWTDSTNVLCWLRAPSKSLHTFVGHKIARIQTTTPRDHWNWVPTDQNPADIPSRGASIEDLGESTLWWHGPSFLISGQRHWPRQPEQLQPTEDTLREVKKGDAFSFLTQEDDETSGETHSQQPSRQLGHVRDGYNLELDGWPIQKGTWREMLRLTAWCMRWRNKRRGRHLTGEEIRRAELCIWRHVQRCCFARTLKDLQEKGKLSSLSTLAHLRPFLAPDGLLRTNARLRLLLHLPYEVRHQIILPKDHSLVQQLLQHVHGPLLQHGGVQHVLSHILRRYWIVRGRSFVRSVVSSCVSCRRLRAQPSTQEMAPLPPERVPQTRTSPFAHTALDMAGPFRVKYDNGGKDSKAYFLLLTCLVYRAVHLEPLADMSTDSFLQAFQRFTARRGTPLTVLSDHGSNFIGGRNELRRLWNKTKQDAVQRKLENIIWDFTPPRGPHFGGIYERLIRSVKNALYHTFTPDHVVTWELFFTTLTVVEGILNTRPLAYIGTDPADIVPLTPADFLGTSPYHQLPTLPQGNWNMRRMWHHTQERLDKLWRRWCLEVRPHLQAVSTWRKQERPIREGDVVAFLDEKRRGKWPLGKIVEVTPSRDGQVRRVHVLVDGSVYVRPIQQVAVLLPADRLPLPPPPTST